MREYADVNDVRRAYRSILTEYDGRVQEMLAAARDPNAPREAFAQAADDVAALAGRLSELRSILTGVLGSLEAPYEDARPLPRPGTVRV